MGLERIVILTGGAFNGKSIIAAAVASYFRFATVLSTDTIRNVLKVCRPRAEYLNGSTYLFADKTLQKQKRVISDTIKDMIQIYKEYGERLVIEGMHFSEEFLKWTISQPFHRICIHNLLPLRERVLLKGISRARLSLYDPATSERIYGVVDETNVDQSVYMRYEQRIGQIQQRIIDCSRECGFQIIEFDEINYGIAKAVRSVNDWIPTVAIS